MFLELIRKDKNRLEIVLKNLDISFINGIRRVIMGNIGGYAFDDIEIKKNTTIFHDEYIKHRIGLVPLIMKEEGTFSGGLKNEGKEDKYLLSEDIKCIDNDIKYDIMGGIPVLVVSRGEEIEFIAKTRKGIAGEDMKYSLVETINFLKAREIEDKEIPEEVSKYVYKKLYYGRKYLLEKYDIKYKGTNKYYMRMVSIYDDIMKICMKGLKEMRKKLEYIRDKPVEIIIENDKYYNYRIKGVDYMDAGILRAMLTIRENVKFATYTRKHFLDKFFEFKLEMERSERLSILRVKEEQMNKAIDIVDKLIEELEKIEIESK